MVSERPPLPHHDCNDGHLRCCTFKGGGGGGRPSPSSLLLPHCQPPTKAISRIGAAAALTPLPTKMRAPSLAILLVLAAEMADAEGDGGMRITGTNETAASKKGREGKFFNLFNIVQFQNGPCSSQSSINSDRNRNGTCLTNTECVDQGGIASGNCAAGFGTCCLFILTGSGTITQNCTYIQSPGFPNVLTDTTTLTYTIQRCSQDVCDIRLDFETFDIRGTASTAETLGGTCMDSLTLTTTTGPILPVICGENTGQHVYLDVGSVAGATATATFMFAGVGNRMFEIKATQVECDNNDSRPPEGCFQYHEGVTGRIETFNFQPNVNTETHLASHRYSACIRQEEGFSCVEYSVCSDVPAGSNGFSLTTSNDAGAAVTMAMFDTICTEDYVLIDGSSAFCSCGDTVAPTRTRYCGIFLHVNDEAVNIPICDCSPPFFVGVVLDDTNDANDLAAGSNTNAAVLSMGACLEYRQIAC